MIVYAHNILYTVLIFLIDYPHNTYRFNNEEFKKTSQGSQMQTPKPTCNASLKFELQPPKIEIENDALHLQSFFNTIIFSYICRDF